MKFSFWLIWLSIWTAVTTAQINVRSIESYSVKDGLSQTSVHSIFKDSRGLLWLGTEGGINKYNGYEITAYQSFDAKNILSSRGTIYDIIEDDSGNIWFGSSGMLSRLNIHSESVDNLETTIDKKDILDLGVVLNLFQDSKGNIWFGTFGKGFYKISSDRSKLQNYRNDPDSTHDSSLDYVRDFYEDYSGSIWIATYSGLVKYDPTTDKLRNIFYEPKFKNFKHTTIFKVLQHDKENLLLFTRYEGILLYNIETDSITQYDDKINKELKTTTLRDAEIDKEGRIWTIAYGKGVFIINPATKELQNLANIVDRPYKQSLSGALSIHVDSTGIAWIGTQHNGLLKVILGQKYINTINNNILGFENIESNVINTVAKDSNGTIWFSTNSGLYKIDSETKKLQRLSLSNQFSPNVFKIYNIEFTKNNAWLSLGSYLVKYDLLKDTYEMIEVENNGTITELNIIEPDKFIIGTVAGNMYFYEPSTGQFNKIKINGKPSVSYSILDTHMDTENILWIATNNGLFFCDIKTDSLNIQFGNLNLRLDYITSITGLGKTLWFGTYGDGMYSYNTNTAKLKHYTYQDGLLDNIIYAVMFDSEHKLWMSSNRGIMEFNPATNIIRTFDVSDGLQGYEHNSKAYSQAADGEMFFGGVNGFSYFYPFHAERNNIPPSILIDNVILYDSVVVRNIYKGFNKTYEFDYDENSISFEFTALDFMNPAKNSYEYKLEGVNSNWIKAGRKRYATFPNINPGKYKFIVRGTNSDQVLNEEGASFSFVILPPFWASWWFRTILISLTILIIYSIYKFRMMSQEKRLREIEAIRKKIADDFHDDLGHKLTRISLYSEMIKNQDEFGTNINQYLNKISEASNSLFYETKDFIWSIDPGNDTLYDVLVYIKDFGDDFFSRSGIAFKVDEINEDLKCFVLPMKWKREIVLIFKEAMNNVIKHSQAKTAEIKTSIAESQLTISLCDDGIGFNFLESANKGRGLSSFKKRAEIIGGKLNVESDNTGTRIHLSLETKTKEVIK